MGYLRWSQTQMIIQAVAEVMEQNKLARTVVRLLLQNPKMGSKDRKVVAAAIYEIIKNYRLYSWLANGEDLPASPIEVLGVYLSLQADESANNEIRMFEINALEHQIKDLDRSNIKYSMPDWIANKWDDGLEIPKIMIEKAPLFIRVNTLRSDEQTVMEELDKDKILYERIFENCLRIASQVNLQNHQLYRSGQIEIQDEGSQRVGLFTRVVPGNIVIDTCAGAGGKSLQMAALMQNRGRILALDINKSSLNELNLRKVRNKAQIIDVHHYSEIKLIDYAGLADTVICDVPCSGSGTFRREVDRKWKLSSAELAELVKKQQQILAQSWTLVKPGGQLIYATCSLFEEENQEQVNQFLTTFTDAKLIADQLLWPQSGGSDGFYMASFRK